MVTTVVKVTKHKLTLISPPPGTCFTLSMEPTLDLAESLKSIFCVSIWSERLGKQYVAKIQYSLHWFPLTCRIDWERVQGSKTLHGRLGKIMFNLFDFCDSLCFLYIFIPFYTKSKSYILLQTWLLDGYPCYTALKAAS